MLPPGLPDLYVAAPGSSINANNEGDNDLIALDLFLQNVVRADLQRRLEQ